MTAAPELILMRHGETAWSLTGQHTGSTELALTPHGRQMSRRLVHALQGLAFTRVLTSPRLRARQTCEEAGLGQQAQTDTDLAEWDYGRYEGLRTEDIRQQHPGWDLWRDGCPDGETPTAVAARADRLIQRLQPLAGAVALFSHGHFGRVLAARWVGWPASAGQHLVLAPASISRLGFDTGLAPRRVISLWNAVPLPQTSSATGV